MDTTIVKVGGSLAVYPEKLRILCSKLGQFSKKHPLILVPGGGKFADTVRNLDKKYSLSPDVAHRMAVLGIDQYGLLLSNITPNSYVTDDFETFTKKSAFCKLPIFLPSSFILKENPLENSWDVTSDSIALYVTQRLKIDRLVLVKDVDGIYTTDPKKHPDAELLSRVTCQQLLSMRHTSVDKFLPKLLLEARVDCYVVNGQFPERVEAILDGKETACTLIKDRIK